MRIRKMGTMWLWGMAVIGVNILLNSIPGVIGYLICRILTPTVISVYVVGEIIYGDDTHPTKFISFLHDEVSKNDLQRTTVLVIWIVSIILPIITWGWLSYLNKAIELFNVWILSVALTYPFYSLVDEYIEYISKRWR